MLGLAFAVLNVSIRIRDVLVLRLKSQSWTALSASLSISLTSGGSTSVVWGVLHIYFPNWQVQANTQVIRRPGNCRHM